VDLTALASFNSVAAHGGFGHASRSTGQPKATLSRHVRQLEESLGVRLIERGGQTLRLTEEGAALHARTDGLLGEIKEAGQAVGGGLAHPRGRLRVSTTVTFAQMAMGRIAAAFVARYPDVQLELTADDRYVDLVAEGYDVAIRIDPPPETNLVGHCFLRDRLHVVAPASLLRPSIGTDPKAPASVPAVVLTNMPDATIWHVSSGGQEFALRPKPVLRVSSLLVMSDAVRAGAGAALLPPSMMAEDLAAGRVVSWGATSGPAVELWVLHTSRRLISPKVAAFVQFMRSAHSEGTVLDSLFHSP
jgi:DNA-binding transcriptional LysR family regulator